MQTSTRNFPQFRDWLSPTERLLARAEIAQVPRILWEDEEPEFAAMAVYSGLICLLVPTNHRLLLIDQKPFDLRIDGFSYGRIDTVEYDRGLLFGWLNLLLPGRNVELKYIRRQSVVQLCEVITERCAKHRMHLDDQPPVEQVVATVEPSNEALNLDRVLDQLERLVTLRQVGALTEQEFFHQKEVILGTQPHVLEQQKRIARANWLGAGRPFPRDNE